MYDDDINQTINIETIRGTRPMTKATVPSTLKHRDYEIILAGIRNGKNPTGIYWACWSDAYLDIHSWKPSEEFMYAYNNILLATTGAL